LLPLLGLTPPTEGFPWDDLHKIFCACQWMAKVHLGAPLQISTGFASWQRYYIAKLRR